MLWGAGCVVRRMRAHGAVCCVLCCVCRQAGSVCSVLCAGRLDSGLNGWRSARAACHARASCSADQARGGRGAVRSTRAECSERAGLLCSLHADCTAALPVLNIQPACSALRPCRLAPGLHCTRRARGTLRARSAIRSVRCPVCLHTAQSTHCQPACTHSKVHSIQHHVHAYA